MHSHAQLSSHDQARALKKEANRCEGIKLLRDVGMVLSHEL